MTAPIEVMVKRYRCPHCGHSRARKDTTVDHIGRCWRNPDARGCLTCTRHVIEQPEPDVGLPGAEYCAKGVNLTGRPACEHCHGVGATYNPPTGGVSECEYCGGDAGEIKPGPIVNCSQWEAKA